MIQQELHAIQKVHGYLPVDELKKLSTRLNVPLHRIHEVASCFPHYRLTPPPAVEFKVCRDMACHLKGAPEYVRSLKAMASELGGGQVEIGGVSCLGQCDGAVAVMVGHRFYRNKSIAECRSLLRDALANRTAATSPGDTHAQAPATHSPGRSTRPTSRATGWRIDPYEGREEYSAARRFVAGDNVAALLEALKIGELRGMGGAGVPAHQKWSDVRQARGERKFIVVNGDESEPGTFKDRELLLKTPHLVLEGVILAGLLTGAERGYVYIRHEYEPQIVAMKEAIDRAERMGVCGENALGTGRDFPIEVYVSPGGYICGEQSALIEAMEDRRAEPRNKPPLLETNGLYDKPTLVSNVETFAWAPAIYYKGGEWYRDLGVNGGKGARFLSISGDVAKPGVYEVPIGLPLGELIGKHAGGMLNGRRLKAVATSGPSAGFLPPMLPLEDLPRAARERLKDQPYLNLLDVPLDLQAFRDLGLMLGAGLVVYGEDTDMVDQAVNATEFFRNESCGKCVPCRVGCQKLVVIGQDLQNGRYDATGLAPVEDMVGDLRSAMEQASICGLGMVGANPLGTVVRHFRDDMTAYVRSTFRPATQAGIRTVEVPR